MLRNLGGQIISRVTVRDRRVGKIGHPSPSHGGSVYHFFDRRIPNGKQGKECGGSESGGSAAYTEERMAASYISKIGFESRDSWP